MQWLAEHVPEQVLPQLPQFARSLVRSAQMPLQSVVPEGHAQLPPVHTRFPPHTCWQNPQFCLLV
jgi:hypothetical protein